MIGTEEANIEITKTNAASMICDKKKNSTEIFSRRVHQVVLFWEYKYGCEKRIRAQEKTRYFQNYKKALSFKKKEDVQDMNSKKNLSVTRIIFISVVCFFTKTSRQILCLVLIILLLDLYHVSVLYV